MIAWLKKNYLLTTALVLGGVLRFYHLDFQSIWLDELHTVTEANPDLSFAELNEAVMGGEQMPPLYFYIVYVLFKIFGHTVLVARVFSALLGVAAIFAIYRLGKLTFGKTTGLVAAWFLAFNFFHIYYSQEARPYAFFLLFSILSLYWFIKLLKERTWRNSMYYGIFTALMLYGHFFGLLGLAAQCVLFAYFIIAGNPETRKHLFLKGLTAGGVILVLYAPAIKFLLNLSRIKQFWLPAPAPDGLSAIFRAFFGNYEALTVIFSLLIILYFIRYAITNNRAIADNSNDEAAKNEGEQMLNQPSSLAMFVFIAWICISILLILIKSYASSPVLLDRYLIHLLPVILVMAANGLNVFRQTIFKVWVVLLVSALSLINVVYVKQYYSVISKTQFRESTAYVRANNPEAHTVATSLGWHMKYFFNNREVNYPMVETSLEDMMRKMMANPAQIKPFWYIDGHQHPYTLSAEAENFADSVFVVTKEFEGLDIWTKHYVPKNEVPADAFTFEVTDITKFGELYDYNGDKASGTVEQFEFKNDVLRLYGWGFITGQEATGKNVVPVLIKGGKAYMLPAQRVMRPDVTAYYKLAYNVDNCGFKVNVPLSQLEKGTYTVGIYLNDDATNKESLIVTDKVVTK